MDHSLLYVSECLLTPDRASTEVAEIVRGSRDRNGPLGVTGALIYTPGAFAQILEGSEAALATLMDSIRRDKRHRNVREISVSAIEERRYRRWSMAYGGPSTFVFHHIEPLLTHPFPSGGAGQVRALARLMEEFQRPLRERDLGPVGLAPKRPTA